MLPVSYCLTCCYLLLVLYRPPPSSPLFPYTTLFRSLLQMTDLGFGLWAGTAINDTSSVVAAAYSFSNEAGDYATIVKLTRATFIIPICLVYVYLEVRRNRQAGGRLSIRRLIPWFIIWFVCASL